MPVSVPRFLASRIVRRLPRQQISRLMGQVCDRPLSPRVSRSIVGLYRRIYDVDMSDVLPRATPYESFDTFFTRALIPGRRPISDGPGQVVSPADGMLQSMGRIEAGCRIVVKGRPYDVARLIGDETEALSLLGGQYAVVYLSPRDYHRLHAPATGKVSLIRGICGDLFPVNALGDHCTRALLVENKRVVLRIETPDMGWIVLVLVGAFIVGRISVAMLSYRDVPEGIHVLSPPVDITRGDEVGAFHLGSTAVVLADPQAPCWQRPLGLIRVGESLVRFG
ncbi:MAG TPA: archaetidylserine decarboxylase [Polyangiaceae bacterium]|nr:MAG: Phosphatidylserine decarboxylase proenzyme [Deltaproteobacteria bacterium ADurb.Bin207]HNS99646.1 archaetidylserine decarboxylase [Polyangiaceae bacterium]HNZ24477.1 archaetidylserine decarboxylase [Polyangiaceae bacterium]HOD22920.1 archaetidylserine decarboxylase [Polyangiaceae bacterium]HOE50115.1 archaetidylserine decarboxylase [Polyangiaceae bacterium]